MKPLMANDEDTSSQPENVQSALFYIIINKQLHSKLIIIMNIYKNY